MVTNINPSTPNSYSILRHSCILSRFPLYIAAAHHHHRLVVISVLLPNNDAIAFNHQYTASLGSFNYPVNVLSIDDFDASLKAFATLTNGIQGSVLFIEHGATISASSDK